MKTQVTREKVIEQTKRYIFFAIGLFVMAFGIAFSIKGALGTTPISSLPYAISEITSISVGTATIIMHCTLIALQIIILRKKYKLIQLLQLPVALLFGVLIDLASSIISGITYSAYYEQCILCAIGIILVGIGVSMEVTANVVILAGEGLVLAVCQVSKLKFPTGKICFDILLVVTACILSLIFLGTIVGVREGTVVAAVCVGLIAKLFNKIFKKPTYKLFGVHEGNAG